MSKLSVFEAVEICDRVAYVGKVLWGEILRISNRGSCVLVTDGWGSQKAEHLWRREFVMETEMHPSESSGTQ